MSLSEQEMALEVETYIRLCFAILDEECGSPSATKHYLALMGMSLRTYYRLRSLTCGISPTQPCLGMLGKATGFYLSQYANGALSYSYYNPKEGDPQT